MGLGIHRYFAIPHQTYASIQHGTGLCMCYSKCCSFLLQYLSYTLGSCYLRSLLALMTSFETLVGWNEQDEIYFVTVVQLSETGLMTSDKKWYETSLKFLLLRIVSGSLHL